MCRRDEPMSKAQLTTGSHGSHKSYDDGVVIKGSDTSRWQKYGNDRIYPGSADNGYLDIKAGEVVSLEPYYGSGVKEYAIEFDAETEALVFKAVGKPEVVKNSLSGKDEKVIARIPRDVMAWGSE